MDSFKGERERSTVVGDRIEPLQFVARDLAPFFSLRKPPPSPTGLLVNLWLRLTGFLMNTGDFELPVSRGGIFADRVDFSLHYFFPLRVKYTVN